ncbi:hypothetical protein HMSSN036_28950 [Paenibacillus macerans]|nr:hypothetical protein HMSSN036_28950 [Paenibacillus macerans]
MRKLAQEEGAAVKEHKLIAARKQLDEAEPQQRKKPRPDARRPSRPGKSNPAMK